LKEPTVRLSAVSALIPVPTAELKTASLVTVGTVPKLQLPAVPRTPVVDPFQVFAVFCAIAAGFVAAAAKIARRTLRVAPKFGKVMNPSLWNRRLKKPAEARRHLLRSEVW
jgi:hypothetical protein